MRAYQYTTEVDAPPSDVWQVVVDLEQSPRWRPLVSRLVTEDGRPMALGSTLVGTFDLLGRRETRSMKVVAFEPAQRLATHSEQDGYRGLIELALAAEGNGTRVTLTGDVFAQRFLKWLMLPFVARSGRSVRKRQLESLKALVEQRKKGRD